MEERKVSELEFEDELYNILMRYTANEFETEPLDRRWGWRFGRAFKKYAKLNERQYYTWWIFGTWRRCLWFSEILWKWGKRIIWLQL